LELIKKSLRSFYEIISIASLKRQEKPYMKNLKGMGTKVVILQLVAILPVGKREALSLTGSVACV